MAERYSKLFSLSEDLYTEGSPVVVAAGALLFDNKTNKVLAQLKVRNIGGKAIKAVTVKITPLDTAGRPLGEPVMSQYLDLVVNRDQEFGQKLPIKLPNNATRSFSVSVAEVVFDDNEIWTCSRDDWKPLPVAKPLESWLTDRELLKQYKMRYGHDCSYVPEQIEDLWHCTCGATNHSDEETCHICRKSRSTLLSVDINQLIAEKDSRLRIEAEAEAARLKKKAEEEAARQKREAEEKAAAEAKAAENRRKAQNITIIVLTSLAVIIGAILLLTKLIIPNNNYNKAQALLAEGKYEEATATFEKLGDYKDSADMILECQYQEAIALAEFGEYEKAISIFEVLYDYKDSTSMILECQYQEAIALIESGEYGKALSIFSTLYDYKDSADVTVECNYLYALKLLEEGRPEEAFDYFQKVVHYKDADDYLDRFVYLPETITNNYNGEILMVQFQYSDSGKMTYAEEFYEGQKKLIYLFDSRGMLINKDGVDSSIIDTYIYNEDGTILEVRDPGDYNVREYNEFGNVEYIYYTDGTREFFSAQYDSQHNIKTSYTSNTYKQFGDYMYLTDVSWHLGDIYSNTSVQYQVYFLPDRSEDQLDIIWRNIRLMWEEVIWNVL